VDDNVDGVDFSQRGRGLNRPRGHSAEAHTNKKIQDIPVYDPKQGILDYVGKLDLVFN
jgi:hypothetical protein